MDFIGDTGLVPEKVDMDYVLSAVNLWLYPQQNGGLEMKTILRTINAWLYPTTGKTASFRLRTPETGNSGVERSLPSAVSAQETFQVTVSFTSPADDLNAVGLSDLAPAGPNSALWTVKVEKDWCSPAADYILVDGNKVEIVWMGIESYDQGQEFTATYEVTANCSVMKGSNPFVNGTLTYYTGNEIHEESIGGDVKTLIGDFENPWDLNADGKVNYMDLALFADVWNIGESELVYNEAANFVVDCDSQIVDYRDLQVFGDHWLESYQK